MATAGRGNDPFASNFFRAGRRRMRTYMAGKHIGWADLNNAGPTVFADWLWEPLTGTTGEIKVWNGSAWVIKPVKVWNGSAWVVKPVKRWNGSAWVVTNY